MSNALAHRARLAVLLLLPVALTHAAPPATAPATRPATQPARTAAQMAALPADDFFKTYQDQLDKPLDPQNPNLALTAAAIFHLTNRQRQQENAKLPVLQWSDKLAAAARAHSAEMQRLQYFSHDSPTEGRETFAKRITAAGVPENTAMAENIIMIPLLNLQGEKILIRTDPGGRRTLLDAATRQPARPHTPLTYARKAVTDWMNSPGHRANILNKDMKFLGVGLATGKASDNWEKIWATQNFAGRVGGK